MRQLRSLILSASAAAALTTLAVSPYPQLELKADRFFGQKEWAQAAATYDLMLDERPHIPATYGRAIVSSTMAGDTAAGIRLFSMALDNHVPFDSVFSRVRSTSFELGRTDLYERLLLDIKKEHPWMRRTVNAYLLRYYAFRRDGRNMVAYADIMLQGAPDNIGFLSTKAQGQMLTGAQDASVATYREILRLDPDNYPALLELGNWYALDALPGSPEAAMAADYLGKAYSLRPTPHVAAILNRLGYPPAAPESKKQTR